MSDQKVTTTKTDLRTEVLKVDPEHYEAEDVYRFSNGKKFKSTDKSSSGIYN